MVKNDTYLSRKHKIHSTEEVLCMIDNDSDGILESLESEGSWKYWYILEIKFLTVRGLNALVIPLCVSFTT